MLHNFKIKLVDYVFIIVLIFTNLGDIQTKKKKKKNEFDGKNDFFFLIQLEILTFTKNEKKNW